MRVINNFEFNNLRALVSIATDERILEKHWLGTTELGECLVTK